MPLWPFPQSLQTTLDFPQASALPTSENKAIISGIQSVISAPDQLWQQCFADDNLDTAKDWLLQQRLMDNRFCFQTVREIEISDEPGRISRREIRCAEDRLVIRAIAQVLKPVFSQFLSKDCMHLSGNGGGKAAVAQTQDYISQHPDHHVIKSDVKRYYASIDHVILHEQLHQLLPNEKTLNRLLWNFMRRTIEFGGNYRDVETGLPLGASLSPLFSTLYLSPLDELAKNTPNTFYRRYMDDWVWVFPKKQTLRTTMKKQYGILHALRVAMHPDKTFIGKVKKGFDFLGFHLTPTGVTVSEAALSRHENKVARLYEQDAKPKRIRVYRLRWLLWATLAAPIAGYAVPTKSTACNVDSPAVLTYAHAAAPATFTSSALFILDCSSTGCDNWTVGNNNNRLWSTTPPLDPISFSSINSTTTPDSPTSDTSFPMYLTVVSSDDRNCFFQFDSATSAQVFSPSPLVSPQNIPIFGPFGLMAMLFGLLWFGNRRQKD